MSKGVVGLPKRKFDLASRECQLLCEEFGERNVEETMIYITKACSSKGLRVAIDPPPEMVRAILEAVHGRLGVNEVRVRL